MMNSLLYDVSKELFRLNTLLEKSQISLQDMQKEEKKYADFIRTQEKLQEMLAKVSGYSLENKSEFLKNILAIDDLLKKFEDYIEHCHENVRAITRGHYKQYTMPQYRSRFEKTNKFHKKSKRYIKKHAHCLTCLADDE